MPIPFHDRRTGEVLYHGTNAALSAGDVILPAKQLGESRLGPVPFGPASWSASHAHATPDAHVADMFAGMASRRKGGTPSVYQVAPINENDVEHGHGVSAVSPTGFKVVKKVQHDPSQGVWKISNNRIKYTPENYGK